jgi:hypothetical protein
MQNFNKNSGILLNFFVKSGRSNKIKYFSSLFLFEKNLHCQCYTYAYIVYCLCIVCDWYTAVHICRTVKVLYRVNTEHPLQKSFTNLIIKTDITHNDTASQTSRILRIMVNICVEGLLGLVQHFAYRGGSHRRKSAARRIIGYISLAYPMEWGGRRVFTCTN